MKSDVLVLVDDFSLGQADPNAASRFYDEIVRDFGRAPYLVNASLVALAAGATGFTLPASAVAILAAFYDDDELVPAMQQELALVNPQWRDERSAPSVYTAENETSREYVLYPRPGAATKDFIFLFGAPMGVDFPEYAIGVVHTETREDVLPWMELPLALFILTREYLRESPHRDPMFAEACQRLGNLMWRLAGR